VGAADVTTSITYKVVVVRRSNRLDAAILHTQAKAALTALIWKPAIAAAVIATDAVAQGAEVTTERLIFDTTYIEVFGGCDISWHERRIFLTANWSLSRTRL